MGSVVCLANRRKKAPQATKKVLIYAEKPANHQAYTKSLIDLRRFLSGIEHDIGSRFQIEPIGDDIFVYIVVEDEGSSVDSIRFSIMTTILQYAYKHFHV